MARPFTRQDFAPRPRCRDRRGCNVVIAWRLFRAAAVVYGADLVYFTKPGILLYSSSTQRVALLYFVLTGVGPNRGMTAEPSVEES